MSRFAVLALGVALAACQAPAPQASCDSQRQAFDRAFALAVERGAAKDFAHQKTYLDEAQKTYLAMDEQGCCRQSPNVCPALNVHQ